MRCTATSAVAGLVAPDETLYDVYRVMQTSRGTGLECLDAHLPGGRLAPGELVVLHGEASAGKNALLRAILAAYVAPATAAGRAVPVVLIDGEGSFDIFGLAQLIQKRCRVGCSAPSTAGAGSHVIHEINAASTPDDCDVAAAAADAVDEALSRLLVLRPREPADLLRYIHGLRDIFGANPTTGLLVVDSMSVWQPLAGAFPRSTTPLVQEAWRALVRLQREHCVSVVVTCSDTSPADGGAATAAILRGGEGASFRRHCLRHLSVVAMRHDMGNVAEGCSAAAAPFRFGIAPCGDLVSCSPFTLTPWGEVVSVAC